MLPFPATPTQRAATGDPRAAISERYSSKEDYVVQTRDAARQLAGEGYMLEEDIEVSVSKAAVRYDYFAANGNR